MWFALGGIIHSRQFLLIVFNSMLLSSAPWKDLDYVFISLEIILSSLIELTCFTMASFTLTVIFSNIITVIFFLSRDPSYRIVLE